MRLGQNWWYLYNFVYFPDDALAEVEQCRRDISTDDCLLLVVQFAGLNVV